MAIVLQLKYILFRKFLLFSQSYTVLFLYQRTTFSLLFMAVFLPKLFVAKLHFQTRSKKDNFFEPKNGERKFLFISYLYCLCFFALVFIFYFGCFSAIFNAVFVEIPDYRKFMKTFLNLLFIVFKIR